jgi:hypothetical protein
MQPTSAINGTSDKSDKQRSLAKTRRVNTSFLASRQQKNVKKMSMSEFGSHPKMSASSESYFPKVAEIRTLPLSVPPSLQVP